MTSQETEALRKAYFEELEKELEASYSHKPALDSLGGKWSKMAYSPTADTKPPTGVDVAVLKEVGMKSVEVPSSVVSDNTIGSTLIF